MTSYPFNRWQEHPLWHLGRKTGLRKWLRDVEWGLLDILADVGLGGFIVSGRLLLTKGSHGCLIILMSVVMICFEISFWYFPMLYSSNRISCQRTRMYTSALLNWLGCRSNCRLIVKKLTGWMVWKRSREMVIRLWEKVWLSMCISQTSLWIRRHIVMGMGICWFCPSKADWIFRRNMESGCCMSGDMFVWYWSRFFC